MLVRQLLGLTRVYKLRSIRTIPGILPLQALEAQPLWLRELHLPTSQSLLTEIANQWMHGSVPQLFPFICILLLPMYRSCSIPVDHVTEINLRVHSTGSGYS
jgi:hypothetical protein